MIEVNGQKYALKYLFEARYSDGNSYLQGADDISLQREDKNAFYDVFYAPIKPLEELESFILIGDSHTYLVSLIDGHFEVDGIPFRQHEIAATEFRLIFYKTHRHDFNQGGDEIGHTCTYVIGWQTTLEGKNYEYKIAIE